MLFILKVNWKRGLKNPGPFKYLGFAELWFLCLRIRTDSSLKTLLPFLYSIVLLQFIILATYKLGIMPVDQSLNNSFKLVGYYLTTPLGEESLIPKKETKKVPASKKKE